MILMLLRWIVHLQLERRIQCERFRFGLETLNDTTAPHLQWDLPVRVCHFRLCWFAERPLLTGLQTKNPGCLMCDIFGKKCWPNEPGSFRVNVNNETTGEKTSRGSSGHDFTNMPRQVIRTRTTLGWLLANLSITPYGSYCLSSGWALARSISATGGQIIALVSPTHLGHRARHQLGNWESLVGFRHYPFHSSHQVSLVSSLTKSKSDLFLGKKIAQLPSVAMFSCVQLCLAGVVE